MQFRCGGEGGGGVGDLWDGEEGRQEGDVEEWSTTGDGEIFHMILDGLTPHDLGLPFDSYRPIQLEAIEQAAYGDAPYQALAIPTGGGKSLVAVSVARLMNWRTIILTSTKSLQEQYGNDFSQAGMVDIRGRANYPCPYHRDCRNGQRMGCTVPICTYEQAKTHAKFSDLIVTNYDYWMHVNKKGGGLGEFDLLVLDEAARSPEHLSSFLSIRIHENELLD